MQALQPKINELKEKYKDDKPAEMKAMMELYREHDFNPAGSCLPILIQFPILIALYQVFIRSLNGSHLEGLYHFIPDPGLINPYFLHFIPSFFNSPARYSTLVSALKLSAVKSNS